MKTVTIKVTGFLGDILFASSVARKLRVPYDKVYFAIRFWEPYELLMNNPFIDDVQVNVDTWVEDKDNHVFELGDVDQRSPATAQFQLKCNIVPPGLEYEVFTNANFDTVAKEFIRTLRASKGNKPVVAYQSNWEERTFGFTREEYARGIDIPPLGYGGRRRNIGHIMEPLVDKYTMVEVGIPQGTPLGHYGIFAPPTFSMTASLIKACDWMIGGEGGLTNLAAGVGTKTIITGDFIHQLYGPNGCIKKINNPMMGPKTYFPNEGHVTLDPFLTDAEVANQIMETIG